MESVELPLMPSPWVPMRVTIIVAGHFIRVIGNHVHRSGRGTIRGYNLVARFSAIPIIIAYGNAERNASAAFWCHGKTSQDNSDKHELFHICLSNSTAELGAVARVDEADRIKFKRSFEFVFQFGEPDCTPGRSRKSKPPPALTSRLL